MTGAQNDLSAGDYQALGAFRYQIRRFLHFSEEAARTEDLEPQQHQMLLAILVLGDAGGPTVGKLAEHLLIRPHSAVGLADRLAERGLVERTRGGDDHREVRLRLTRAGRAKLRRLSAQHRDELRRSGPLLVAALSAVLEQLSTTAGRASRPVAEEGNVSETQEHHR